MDSEILEFLRRHRLFLSLSDDVLDKFIGKFSLIDIKSGEFLFHQGDISDYVYILYKGRLTVLLTTADNHIKPLGYLEEGETVGDFTALSGDLRAASVKAQRDSLLLRIASRDFIDWCYQYPSIMHAMIQPLITRTHGLTHNLTSENSNNYIAIVPAHLNFSIERFSQRLLPHIQSFASSIVISDFASDFNDQTVNPDEIRQRVLQIERNKKHRQRIFYILKSPDTVLAQMALKKAEMIYLVADSAATPGINPTIFEKANSNQRRHKALIDLVLLHSEKTQLPQGTAAWLQLMQFNLHHHIKIDTPRHYQRLLRFMRRHAFGLVLGGGGTRGWAHLGAIKALREEKIAIDFVGGSSVGAMIAGCYATQESYEDAYEKFRVIAATSSNSTSWSSLTWPIISIFNAESFTEAQQRVFGDTRIEDLWLPYFCISTNLSNYIEAIHTHGLLWERVRASSSIPGMIPPMVINGEIHLDGGLLNNLPIDIMRQFLGHKGQVIAVELNNSLSDFRRYNFPPILTLKQALLNKFHLTQEPYVFPRFIDTFLRGLLAGSSAKTKQNVLNADILVNLNLNKFRLLHFSLQQATQMIEVGYFETLLQIKKYKEKK